MGWGKLLGNKTKNTTRQKGSASPSAPSSASASSLWDNWVKKQQEEEEERKKKQQEANAAGGNNAGLSDQAENHNAQTSGSGRSVIDASIDLSRKILANKKAAEDTGFAAYADALKTDPQKMAAARKAGATATADGQAKDHAHVYQTNDPYDLGNEYLNQMMALNLEAAKGWNVKSWDGLSLKDDIKDITKRWYENRKTSEALNLSNPTGKDPLGAADALMKKEMDQLRAKYESNGRTYDEMRELMAGQDIRDPYEIERENQKKVIRDANTLYNQENPQAQAEWRRMFKDAQADKMAPDAAAGQRKSAEGDATPYDDLGNAARNIRQGNGYLVSAEERQAFEEFAQENPDVMATNDTRAIQEAAAEWGKKRAAQRRQEMNTEALKGTWEEISLPSRVMDYSKADAYLRERDKNGLYAIARDTPERVEELAGMLENAGSVIRKLQETGGKGLTDDELTVLYMVRDASGNPDALGEGISTEDGVKALETVGAQLAQDLRGQAAAYPGAQKWGAYEQGLWDELIRTPEGAQYYAENARGTDKESRAKENLYWANQEERIRAALADPDFEALSKPQGNDGELMNKIDMFGPATYADYMDDRDKALYYYYLNTGKEDEAHKYLEALKYSINEKKALEDKENQQKKLNEGNVLDWIGENLWSIPESVIGGPMGMADLIGQNWGNVEKPEWMPDWLWRGINPYSALNNGEYKPVDTNSQWQYLSKNAQTTREETSQKIAELSESVGVNSYLPVQVYNGVMSLLDSRAGAELMNGLFGSTKTASTLGAFLTGTRSGQEYMLKAYENGGSDEQALQMGLVAGFFETAWEKLELSIFFKTANTIGPKAAWEKLVEFGLVTLENGLQEGGTKQSNLMAEQWIMGDLSEMEQMASYLSDMGMNEDEIKKAIQDQWMQRVWDATVGGLIMGGISDAAAQSMSAYKTSEYNKQAASLMNKNTKQTLADLAKASADETTRKMGEKFDAATATDKQAGKLLAQVTKNLPEEMRGKVQGLMREQVRMSAQEELAPMTLDVSNALILRQAGMQLTDKQEKALREYYNGLAVADSIAALFAQQELTQEQIAALASSEKGMDIVRRIMNSDNAADSENGNTEENNAEDRQTNQDEEWEDMPTAQDEETREPEPLQNKPEERRAAMDEEARDEGEPEPQPEPLQNGPEERRAILDEEARDEGEQEPEPLKNRPEERRAILDEEARDEGEQEPEPLQNGPEERRAAMDEEEQNEGEQGPERRKENAVPVRVKGEDAEHRAAFRVTDDGMEAELEDGTRRSADELELTDAQRRAVEEAGALRDDAAANDMIDMLQGEQDENGVRKKAKAYGEAYRQGLSGAEFDAGSLLYDGLTEDEARRAYEMGKKQAQQQAQRRAQSAREAAKRDGYRAEADANAEENGLFYGDVEKGATDSQRKVMLRLIDPYAREHGLHVVAHDDMGDVNGKYRKDDRTIHISLNADDGNLTRVASHEIFHFVMDQDAEQGGRLRDFVIEQLQNQKGYDLEGRIQDIQDTYRDAKGQELSRDEALEEIAADALGDIIGTEDNLKKLIRREQAANPGDLSLAERLKNWLGRIIQRFKALQKRFQQSSPEGLALQDQTDTLEKMRQMIETALQTIQKNREGAKAGLYDGISDDADVKAYVAEKDTAATQEDADAALNVLLAQLFNRTQQAWIGNTIAKEKEREKSGKMDENFVSYEQGFENFVDALGKFGRGEVNSVAVAMVRMGLDAPMGATENQLYSYAARQIAEQGYEENRYSIKDMMNLTWEEQVDRVDSNRARPDDIMVIAKEGEMSDYGIDDLIALRQSVYEKATRVKKSDNSRSAHELSTDTMKQLRNAILHPAAIIKNQRGTVIVTDLFDNEGRPIIVPLTRKSIGRETYIMDAASVYGRDNLPTLFGRFIDGKFLEDQGTKVYLYKNNAIDILRTSPVSYGTPENITDAIRRLSQNNENVNEKLSVKRDADQSQRNREAVEGLRQDAELYAQMKQDADARAAYLMLMQLHDMTTRGGKDALIQKGAFEGRLSDVAQKILNEYGSEYGKNKLMKELRKVYQGMEQNQYSVSEMLAYTTDVMRDVLEKSPGTKMEQSEATKQILKVLQEKPFWMTSEQKAEIAELYGNTGIYKRKNVGKMRIVSKGMLGESLADLWTNELSPLMPEVFKEDAREQDMPMILDRWMQNAGSRRYSDGYGANAEAEAASMAINAILDFYDVPGALQTKEDIQKITWSARNAIRIAKEQYNQRYHELLKERTETKNKQELRKSIERTVKTINKLNVSPSDQRHVPEGMRRAALDAVRPFLNDTSVFSQANLDRLNRIYGILAERKGEAAGFDEDILESIRELGPKLNGRRLSQLTEQELSDINDIVGNVHKAITGANEAFLEGRKTTVDALSGQLKADMQDRTARQGKLAEAARKLSYRETTPTYFADRAGGVIKEMVKDLFRGQETWAFTMQKAKAYADEQIDKYNVKQWINDKETLRFDTRHGGTIELNRKQAMSLYALWKRENTNRLQEAKHLRVGGFLYERGTNYKGVDTMKPHPLTEQDMAQIKSWLTPEQMEFVDKMVGYLSDDLSKAGNEVSMALYGYEKFKEAYYFPYVSGSDYLGVSLTENGENVKQPKNKGWTKALQRNAATPITISDFMDTWANHVNEMSIYAGFAQTMDTMNRVFNDKIKGDVKTDKETKEILKVIPPESNWAIMRKALGSEGVNYLKTLARDISGGVRADERGWAAKGLSRFKKSAVAGNLSVVLQQPTAYARAMMMVSPKYLLTANPAHIARNIKEMYKYSGVAIIKKMGKFDTGTGQSAVEWLTDGIKEETAGKRILSALDEWTGKGAEKADEWTWGLLWGAISKEVENTRTDLNRGTDEFGRAVAERFNDVVNHTQVYDSVLSRSEWMRSNATIDKMATSFMAEPTLSLNMLQDAIVRYKEEGGGTKRVARAAGTFALNALLTALAKSVMTATRRKDDEGRTWLEKYLAEAAGNFADDISPFGLAGLIPWVRDAVSIFEGYSVERSDMDAVEMLYKAYKTLANDNKSFEDKMQEVCGAVGNLFGIPVKNVWRDMEGIARNMFFGASAPISETSGRDIKYSVLDNLSMGPISLWSSENKAYYDRLEKAALNGDTALYEELYGYLTETKQVKPSSVISGLKNEIKDSYTNGLITEDKALDVLTGTLGMEKNDAYWMLDELNAKKAGQEDGYSKYSAFDRAIETGQNLKAEVKRYTEHGVEEKTMASHITSQYKQQYVELMKAGKKAEAANLKARLLTAYEALGYDRTKKNEDIDDWMKQEEKKNK